MFKKTFGIGLLVGAIALAYAGAVKSGLDKGEYVSAFHPNHVTGPHAGTDTCPPCTFGVAPQVQLWVNGDDPENVAALGKLLNDTMAANKKAKLNTFVIFVTEAKNKSAMETKIKKIAEKTGTTVSLAWIDKNDQAIGDYKINTDSSMKNTVFVYKGMKVVDKFVNLKADEQGLSTLEASIQSITK